MNSILTFEQLRGVTTCQGFCWLVNCILLCEVCGKLTDVVRASQLGNHWRFVDLVFELLPVELAEKRVRLEVLSVVLEAQSLAGVFLEKFGDQVASVFANLK